MVEQLVGNERQKGKPMLLIGGVLKMSQAIDGTPSSSEGKKSNSKIKLFFSPDEERLSVEGLRLF